MWCLIHGFKAHPLHGACSSKLSASWQLSSAASGWRAPGGGRLVTGVGLFGCTQQGGQGVLGFPDGYSEGGFGIDFSLNAERACEFRRSQNNNVSHNVHASQVFLRLLMFYPIHASSGVAGFSWEVCKCAMMFQIDALLIQLAVDGRP